jgi:hypothetical protein
LASREALGGNAVMAVKTLLVEGTRTRTMPDGQAMVSLFEIAGPAGIRGGCGRNVNGVDPMRTTASWRRYR